MAGAPAKSDYIIEVIGVDKAGAVFASVQQAMDSVTASTAKATASAERQKDTLAAINKSYLSIRAVASDVAMAMGKVWDSAKRGAGILALERQVEAVQGAAEAIDAINKGSRGTIDDEEIAKVALRISDLNLSLKDLGTIGAYSLTKSAQTGEDAQQVLQRVGTAFDRGRFGALGFGKEVRTSDAALAAMTRTVEQGADAIDPLVTDLQRAEVAMGNFKDRIDVLVAGSFGQFIVGLEAIRDHSAEMAEKGKESNNILAIQRDYLEQHSAESIIARAKAEAFAQTMRLDLGDALSFVNDELREWAPNTLAAADATERLADAAERLSGNALAALIAAGVGAGAGEMVNPSARSVKGAIKGARGGAGSREAASVRVPSYADIFGFTGAEASFLGGLSGGTLGGAEAAYAGERGNFGGNGRGGVLSSMTNAGPMLDQSTQALLDFAETMRGVEEEVGGAFEGIGDAFGGMLTALTDSGAISKTGAAAKALAAVQLTALAAQAGVKAVWEFAEGLAAAARYEYWSAAQHFAASVQYGVVAGTNVAKAVSGVGGGSGSSKSATDRPSTASDYLSARQQQREAGPTVIVINGPAADYTHATASALDQLGRRGYSIPADVLTPEIRRQLSRWAQAA